MQYERRWVGIQESLLSNTESNGLASVKDHLSVCGGVDQEFADYAALSALTGAFWVIHGFRAIAIAIALGAAPLADLCRPVRTLLKGEADLREAFVRKNYLKKTRRGKKNRGP